MIKLTTPETDALILSKEGFGATNYEWREHSRRLERERDEAREAFAIATDEMVQAQCRTREANCKLADALQEVDLRTLDYERMKQERDEARERAVKLAAQLLAEMEETK